MHRCTTSGGTAYICTPQFTSGYLAGDAAALIEALGIAPAAVVGWSMGGSILHSMLINHGEKVRRAVLLSTLPSYTEIQHRWLDALLTLRRADVDPLVQSVIGMPWGFTPRILADHEAAFRAAQLAARNPYPTSLAGYEAQGQAIRVYDSRPRLPEVRVPTLVLAGAEDVLTPVHQAVEIARLIPGADLTVLPRGGHAMPVEYPEATAGAIRAFLIAEPVPVAGGRPSERGGVTPARDVRALSYQPGDARLDNRPTISTPT